jgi:hypothetical protein
MASAAIGPSSAPRAAPFQIAFWYSSLDDVGNDLARSPRLRLPHGGLDGLEVGLAEEAVGFHGVLVRTSGVIL